MSGKKASGGRSATVWGISAGVVVLALVAVVVTQAFGRNEQTPLAEQPVPQERVNLNTASRQEFLAIPNVGNRMVREFMEYRPYVSIRQFRREIGKYVDLQQVAEYEQFVYVPIDFNRADVETLQQLPGVDGEAAATLVAMRPYADMATFLAQLASIVQLSEEDSSNLRAMLVGA